MKLNLTQFYVYNDISKVYSRKPFIAHFKLEDSSNDSQNDLQNDPQNKIDFWMVNLHLRPKPKLALSNELAELRKVVDEIKYKNIDPNIVIMGDMNFDCAYANETQRTKIKSVLSDFTFYIDDGVATTISNKLSCAYDRILINNGSGLSKMVVPSSHGPYYYNNSLIDIQDKVSLKFN